MGGVIDNVKDAVIAHTQSQLPGAALDGAYAGRARVALESDQCCCDPPLKLAGSLSS